MKVSLFDKKLIGRKQLVFIIKDVEGEKFGYYLNTRIKIENNDQYYTWTDNKSFEFNIESNGRLDRMMKFEIKDTSCGYALYDKSNNGLIEIGDISLGKENKPKLNPKYLLNFFFASRNPINEWPTNNLSQKESKHCSKEIS